MAVVAVTCRVVAGSFPWEDLVVEAVEVPLAEALVRGEVVDSQEEEDQVIVGDEQSPDIYSTI